MDGHGSWLRDYLLSFKADGPETKRIPFPESDREQGEGKSCPRKILKLLILFGAESFFVYFFGELECVGYSFAYVAHYVFLRDV
jgi:hypothetical protein